MKKKEIWFDMDGTIADFYNVPNWLDDLQNFSVTPYRNAKPVGSFSQIARQLNRVQKLGYSIGIISWTSKISSYDFDRAIEIEKIQWLARRLPSVHWDAIHIVPYGTPKSSYRNDSSAILFDDSAECRQEWGKNAKAPNEILEVLKWLK